MRDKRKIVSAAKKAKLSISTFVTYAALNEASR